MPRNDHPGLFKPGQSGNPGGRPSHKWIREFLSEESAHGTPRRAVILKHLYAIATKWEIRKYGRDIEVASGRDAVEAAKVIFAYDLGQPVKYDPVALAEHFRKVDADKFSQAMAILGSKLNTMDQDKAAALFESIVKDPQCFFKDAQKFCDGAPVGHPVIDVIEKPELLAEKDEDGEDSP